MASNLLTLKTSIAQRSSHDEMVDHLREILTYVKQRSPLYRRKLVNVDIEAIQSLNDAERLPFTTRADLQEAAPFGTLCDGSIPQAYYESSGTSGSPVPGFPDLSYEKSRSFGVFLDQWMGLSQARVSRALVGLAFEMNPTGIRFQNALPYAGVTVLPVGVRTTICPPEKVLDIILRMTPQAIFARPFELLRYADALLAQGTPPEKTEIVKAFFLGEIMSPAKWKRIQSLWDDVDLYGHYGLTELDSGLQTCHAGFYHEPASPFLLTEVVDPNGGRHAQDDEWGELVFSNLRVSHAPLIRYRTGDLGRRLSGRCSCGGATPHYEIRGRLSDGLPLEGGKTLYPIDLEQLVYTDPDFGNEYIFVIESDGALRLVLERALGSSADLSALSQRIVNSVRDRFPVSITAEVWPFGKVADKLGIPKKKSGRFTDLRGLNASGRRKELEVNVVDFEQLRAGDGRALSI